MQNRCIPSAKMDLKYTVKSNDFNNVIMNTILSDITPIRSMKNAIEK